MVESYWVDRGVLVIKKEKASLGEASLFNKNSIIQITCKLCSCNRFKTFSQNFTTIHYVDESVGVELVDCFFELYKLAF